MLLMAKYFLANICIMGNQEGWIHSPKATRKMELRVNDGNRKMWRSVFEVRLV